MCLAVPAKVLKREGTIGWVDLDGCQREVRLDLVDSVKVGEYVIVHAGFAIQRLDEEQAKATLELLQGETRISGLD